MKLFLWIFIATLFHNFIMTDSKDCNLIEIESEEKLISEKLNILLIESDQDEFQNLNYDQFKIVNESLRISNIVENQIISTQIIENYSFKSIDDKVFCIFIKFKTYQISCIRVFNLYSHEVLNYKENNILLIQLNNLDDYFCQEFFLSQESQFKIFCYKNYYLNIYSVDLDNTVNLSLSLEIPQRQYELCKKTVFQFMNNSYLISFFQCEEWGLYQYNNQEMKIILNEELTLNDFSIQIKYLENIQICKETIYLLIQNGFHQFVSNQFAQIQYQIFYSSPQNLIQITLSQRCHFISFVLYDSSINKTTIQRNEHKFEYQFEGRLSNIKLLQGILMVYNQVQLQVIYNYQFQQIIKLNSTEVFFNDLYGLIYFYDQILNEIIFYKFSYPRNVIQPTLKYIIYAYSYQYLHQEEIKCFQVQYITKKNSQSILVLNFHNKCQNTVSLFYSKKGLQLPYQYQINIDKDYKFGIKISDEQSFFLLCPNQKNTNQQDRLLLYYETHYQGFSVLKKNFIVYVQNCYGLPKFQINTRECQVFSFQSYILLWCQNKNGLRFINFKDETIKEIKVDGQITNIVQFKNSVLIFTSKDLQLFDLHFQGSIILNQNIVKILKILNEIQLKDNLQINQKTFYYQRQISIFIQYFQFLIVKVNSQIITFRLENIQIVFIQEFPRQQFLIIGIHLNCNQIINYLFDFQQLSILYTFQMGDYEIIRPLNYQINEISQYLAITCRKENKNFVLLFKIRLKGTIKLIKILEINKFQFFFNSDKFFYYNSKGEITVFNLSDFEIQLENLLQQEMEFIENSEVSFKIISADQTDPILNMKFTIKIYDECCELFQKKDNFLLNYLSLQPQKITISNFFHGPIDSIKILNDNVTQINGPLLLSQITNDQINIDKMQIKIIKFSYISYDNQNQQQIFFFYNRGEDIYIFFQQNQEILAAIPLNEEQILVLFVCQSENQLIGKIYFIQKDQQNYVIKNHIFTINIILFTSYTEIRIFKTGNLIIFQSEFYQIIYMICNNAIKVVQNTLGICKIHKIKGSNDQYIAFYKLDSNLQYFFQILTFIDDHYISYGNITLFWDQILNKFKNLINIDNIPKLYDSMICQILDSIIIEGNLKIVFFQTYRQYSILSHILINLERLSIQFIPQKFLRNGIDQEYATLEFYNKHILILKSFQDVTYFYDLFQDQKIYDYIGKHNQNKYSYFPFNTTHFIIFSTKTGQIQLGEIGYKFDFKNEIINNQTFKIEAQNKVSKAYCNITIFNDNSLNKGNHLFKKILIIFAIILFGYFIIRRILLQRKQLNNLRQSRSIQGDTQFKV